MEQVSPERQGIRGKQRRHHDLRRRNRILTVNRAFSTITGYGVEEVIGRNPRFLGSGVTPRETYQEMWQPAESGSWHGEVVNRRKDGRSIRNGSPSAKYATARAPHPPYRHLLRRHGPQVRRPAPALPRALRHPDRTPQSPLLGTALSQAVGARRTGKSVAVLFIDPTISSRSTIPYGH
ncbi:MAG: PAS domain-containing protein [Betaproteobacteria bacterium]|nr:PAS domain-containing protein [Betaproteobacteria bacterium]